jgi:tetratricopeptide (TPR) repeat protein
MTRTVRLIAAGAISLAAATSLNLWLAGRVQLRPYDLDHVPQGSVARFMSLGHRGLVSDLYWLATVQYIGEPQGDQRGWERLYPLVDLVTDLDPRHGYAYQTAGIVLSASGRLEESDAILKKGMEKGPNWWSYPYYISFNHWFYLGDYETGAHYAEIAARTRGASPNISQLAVSLASKSGTPEQAIELLQELRKNVKDEVSASRLEEQLKLAVLERDAQALERAAATYTDRTGLPLGTLDMLVVSGLVTRIPEDPFGGRYEWDAQKREVRSSANPFRFRLREKARRPEFHYKVPKPIEGTTR